MNVYAFAGKGIVHAFLGIKTHIILPERIKHA